MSKIIKSNTVRLNLQDAHINSPKIITQGSHPSPKPPMGSKSSQGDTSFRIISPKITLSRSNSNHSLSKISDSQIKQTLQQSDDVQMENQNDAVIEDNHCTNTKTQNLTQIKQTLTNISQQISSFRILEINQKTLKRWQNELLLQARGLISLKKIQNTTTQSSEISPREYEIQKTQQSQEELEEILQIEKRRRLEAEELSSRILQDQESQITLLNEKLFKLEQLYSKTIQD